MTYRAAGVGVGCALVFVAAAAQAQVVQVVDDGQAPPPGTLTLDRMDASTRAGVQIGLTKVDPIDGGFTRSDFYGQYVARSKSSGFYGQFPVAHFYNGAGPDATAVGNLEFGGFLLPRRSSATVFRMGLAIGTGHDGPGVATAHVFSSFERLTDFVLTAPGYTTFRLSASMVRQEGAVFIRGDFGLDIALDKPTRGANGIYLRANAAVGLRTTAGVDVTLELVNLGPLDAGTGWDNSMFHTATIGARTRGRHQLHAGAVFPLDESLRGDVWILSLAYHYAVN